MKSRNIRRQAFLSILACVAFVLIVGIGIAVGLSVSLNMNRLSRNSSKDSVSLRRVL